MKQEHITYYKNGFVARFHNRRIECLKREDNGYNVTFIRFSKDPTTPDQLKRFDKTISRMGGTITYVVVVLSEEALNLLSEGWFIHKHNP